MHAAPSRPTPPRTAFLPAPPGARASALSSSPSLHTRQLTPRRAARADADAVARRARATGPTADMSEHPLTRIPRLQDALDDAVANEQYASAAAIRDELATASHADSVQLLSALLSYYDAFNAQSVNRIRKLWRDDNDDGAIPTFSSGTTSGDTTGARVVCQHPLTKCHVGYADVVNSYAALFATLPADLRMDISDVRIAHYGAGAVVTCVENPSCASMAASGRTWHGLLVTTIFEKVWHTRTQRFEFVIVHHVSTPMISGTGML